MSVTAHDAHESSGLLDELREHGLYATKVRRCTSEVASSLVRVIPDPEASHDQDTLLLRIT